MIDLFRPFMPPTAIEAVTKVLTPEANGRLYIGQGVKVDKFEERLAAFLETPYVLTLNSGTSALHLALTLIGVKPGDEVISTPMTCMATNTPILDKGAKIVWADINPETGNLDPASLGKLITSKTRAIVCVHWGGYPCDLSEINAIADTYDLPVMEDAAHAFGAIYQLRHIGTISAYTAFSFQAIKHLTTIDGGALTVRTGQHYRQGKLLRWYGIDRETSRSDFRCEDDVFRAGYKYHMNDVCATIGLEQMYHVDDVLRKHRENAVYYTRELLARNLRGIRPLIYQTDRLGSYWLYTILVQKRDEFITFMKNAGIQVSRVHARNDKHTCFAEFRRDLPGVDEFDAHQCSIPVGWWITPKDRVFIMDKMEEFSRVSF